MEDIILIAAIAFLAGLGLVAYLVYRHLESRRTKQWMQVASRLGLEYKDSEQDFFVRYTASWPPKFKAFAQPQVSTRNILHGTVDGAQIWLGDYQYTFTTGRSGGTARETICVLESPHLALPNVDLHTLSFGDRVDWRRSTRGNIEFADDPAFSKDFVLRGADEPTLRELFDPQVRAWFVRRKAQQLDMEADGRTVVLTGSRIKPQDAERLLDDAREFVALMARNAAA